MGSRAPAVHPENDDVSIVVGGDVVAHRGELARSAERVVVDIEDEHDRVVAAILRERVEAAMLIRQREIRSLFSDQIGARP